MAKRLFDVVLATLGLVVATPILLVAAIGIRLSSPGPILYRARLIGRWGQPFTMYKLRTMHVHAPTAGPVITAEVDPRVFAFGSFLRLSKIDELPQLVNVLRGEMSIVGPRPEHPTMVERYTAEQRETLRVRPGLSSPASLYDYTHGARLVGSKDPVAAYINRLLPLRLELELVYVRRASLRYDIAIIGRTLWLIALTLLGKRSFPDPPELREALTLLPRRRKSDRISPPAKM
ncbi:MAG TPA: sugar transferase [Gemmatimonadales bacterium]|nr:sugar transferase [Gemmatimonadales bacterium]